MESIATNIKEMVILYLSACADDTVLCLLSNGKIVDALCDRSDL
jgi:hypothetical protein